jgi:HNH endonuclease
MATTPDVPCARCGKLLYTRQWSLPPGQRICQPCRTRTARRTCEICGKQYQPGGGRSLREQRTCGRACGVELRHREYGQAGGKPRVRWPSSRIQVRECVWCGNLFTARAGRRACSADCGRRYNWANDKRRTGPGRSGLCACGQQIPLTRGKCDGCRDAAAREAKRQTRRKRKALQRGARTSERYWFADIAARDRYMCGICHKRVAMTKAVPHPRAPTIDHIVPLIEGGADVAANVRLAHFICNSARGCHGGQEQLAMFG